MAKNLTMQMGSSRMTPFFQSGCPSVHDRVVAVPIRIDAELGIFTRLPEFGNIEAFLPISEVTKKRKAVKKLYTNLPIGHPFVAIVTQVNGDDIDLSKRDITDDEETECMKFYEKTLQVVSIVNNIAKVCGIALDPLYTEIVWPLNTIYGHAFNAFESIIMDGKSLFSLLFQSSDNILVIQEKESPIEKDEKEGPIEKDEKDEKEGPIKKDEKESPIEKNENESPIEKDEAIHNGINLESTQLVQASHEAKNVESTNACEKTVLSGSILEKAEQIIIQRLNLPPISFVVELEMVCEGEESLFEIRNAMESTEITQSVETKHENMNDSTVIEIVGGTLRVVSDPENICDAENVFVHEGNDNATRSLPKKRTT